MGILAFNFLRIWKRTCSIAELLFVGFGIFLTLEESDMLSPSLIILEQYLRLYNISCETVYALMESSEVCQLKQTRVLSKLFLNAGIKMLIRLQRKKL